MVTRSLTDSTLSLYIHDINLSWFYFHTQISISHKINTTYSLMLAKKNYNEA